MSACNLEFTIQNSEFSQPLTPDTRHPKPALPSCHSPLATALSVTRPATSPSTSSPKSPPPFAQPLTPDTRNLPLHEVARSCPRTPRFVYSEIGEEPQSLNNNSALPAVVLLRHCGELPNRGADGHRKDADHKGGGARNLLSR